MSNNRNQGMDARREFIQELMDENPDLADITPLGADTPPHVPSHDMTHQNTTVATSRHLNANDFSGIAGFAGIGRITDPLIRSINVYADVNRRMDNDTVSQCQTERAVCATLGSLTQTATVIGGTAITFGALEPYVTASTCGTGTMVTAAVGITASGMVGRVTGDTAENFCHAVVQVASAMLPSLPPRHHTSSDLGSRRSESSTSLIAQRLSSPSSQICSNGVCRSYTSMIRENNNALRELSTLQERTTPTFFHGGHSEFRVPEVNLHCYFSNSSQRRLYSSGGDYSFFMTERECHTSGGGNNQNSDCSSDRCCDYGCDSRNCDSGNCSDNSCSSDGGGICRV